MNIYYLSLDQNIPKKGYWDTYYLEKILSEQQEVTTLEGIDEAIVVIPGANQGQYIDEINKKLSTLKKCTVIITSDEENKFPIDKLEHENITIFATYPHKTEKKVRWLPIGTPPHIENKEKDAPDKTMDIFFAGQINHDDRQEMYDEIKTIEGVSGEIHPSSGFAQGLDRKEYIDKTSKAKVIPAPKGNISPDSFRTWEALELGAIPIVQNVDFWRTYFPQFNFPIIEKKEQWKGYIKDAVVSYPRLNNRIQAEWLREKQNIKHELLGYDDMTVVIPISPIKSHPSIEILEETIKSVKYHTKAEIIIMFDGVRKEQESKRADYEEHIRRVLWKFNDIYPMIFDLHMHQVGMMKKALEIIKTPLILFVEQDTPIVTDEPINWEKIKQFILLGQSNLVRFYHEAHIHPEHKHLMLETKDDFTETAQWSQRPHLASTAFYARILNNYFSPNACSFIEDVLHGKEYEDFIKYGRLGFEQWKTHIYTPKTTNIKRSLHTDGRAGDKKFEQIF